MATVMAKPAVPGSVLLVRNAGRPRSALRLGHGIPGRQSQPFQRGIMRVRASSEQDGSTGGSTTVENANSSPGVPEPARKAAGKGVNLFDPAATASRFITRRFGIVGGLAFVGLLASTELFEIGKALLEQDKEGSGELVELPSGLSYRDIKVGGGPSPRKGDFVGAQFVVKVGEEVVLDTKKTGRPLAFTFGKQPYLSVNCAGVEEGMLTMKRGGIRELVVPPALAFAEAGRELQNGDRIPPEATVTYTITLEEVTGSYL